MKQRVRFTTVLLGIVIIVAFISIRTRQKKEYLDFAKSLDQTAVTIDGTELTLRDLGFYIAYEEQQVEKDAVVYNPGNTDEYWKLHTNGTFIRTAAKKTALDMAIHDEIFYQIAKEKNVKLDALEQKILSNTQYDFWSDLDEEQRTSLGLSQEELNQSMKKIALAEKSQMLYADETYTAYDEYLFNGDSYLKLLEEHEVSVNENIWDRVHFGRVTLDH